MSVVREDTAIQQTLEAAARNAFENRMVCALETGNRAQARLVYAEAQDALTEDSLAYLRAVAQDDYRVDVCYG
ncbi:hypothetical protein CAL26_21155 [Bordetella genomosp. 9]|uniref:Uncharacterized protein n=1 Tax=Bordetella genomosp. 9 TaxID=1416803 RepID=A0A261R4V9_9BORD|nr:hypothetical protein [Bordetella genomosp. 9]OZI20065.1 hypothetical protein CAL26_21155 [Bordetella genomosp. 9]